MGCIFNDMYLPGHLTEAEVKTRFEEEQDQDRYENGHCYSGGFGMADGLEFTGKVFYDPDTAYEWLSKNVKKWEAAKAVRYRYAGKEFWMIGADCAS